MSNEVIESALSILKWGIATGTSIAAVFFVVYIYVDNRRNQNAKELSITLTALISGQRVQEEQLKNMQIDISKLTVSMQTKEDTHNDLRDRMTRLETRMDTTCKGCANAINLPTK